MNITAILGTIGAAVVGAIGLWFHGKNSGKNAEINKQNKQVLNNVEKDKKARDDSASTSIDDQLKQLRDNKYN